MEDTLHLPHKLTLQQREDLMLTGVTEVIRFDENAVVLKTHMGTLFVQGESLLLKTLSLEGGQVAVRGHISAMVYEEPKSEGLLRRLFR